MVKPGHWSEHRGTAACFTSTHDCATGSVVEGEFSGVLALHSNQRPWATALCCGTDVITRRVNEPAGAGDSLERLASDGGVATIFAQCVGLAAAAIGSVR